MTSPIVRSPASKFTKKIAGEKYYEFQRQIIWRNKFFSSKGRENDKIRHKYQFDKLLGVSKDSLAAIHQDYEQDYVARDIHAQERMWEVASNLYENVVSEVGWSSYRCRVFLNEMYDIFFKLESKRSISRPNFIICMKESCRHIPVNNLEDKIGMTLGSLYCCFCDFDGERMNWRRFMFYLHFVSNPVLDCHLQLLQGFTIIASRDCLDRTSSEPYIDLNDIGFVLYPLVRADLLQSVISMFDSAYSQIMLSPGTFIEKPKLSTKITYAMFQKIINHESIKILLCQKMSAWYMCERFLMFHSKWEDEFYNETLYNIVMVSRREKSINDKLMTDKCTLKRGIWNKWMTYTLYQRSLRLSINAIHSRMRTRFYTHGLKALLQWTRKYHAALKIQRLFRGHVGRQVAHILLLKKTSAIMIQCQFRIHLAKKKIMKKVLQYQWAVITIQKQMRGVLGRRIALRKLMSYVEQEHLRNIKEKNKLLQMRGEWSVVKLQAYFRMNQAKILVNKVRKMRRRENDIRQTMELQRASFLEERKIYSKQLEDFYRRKKEEYLEENNLKLKLERDQINIRTLRRRLRNDEKKNAKFDNKEEIDAKVWLREWEFKIEKGVEDVKTYDLHCLDHPDNPAEKKIRDLIMKQIKERVIEVLARASSRCIPIKTKEATGIAKEEVLYIRGEEERARLNAEMETQFLLRETEVRKKKAQAVIIMNKAYTRSAIHAASVIAQTCRIWRAKKELRSRCLKTFEKNYDESSHTFYYTNRITSESSWSKPKAMGMFDIPAKDEWILLRDAHGFPYYYNPAKMDMSWNPPLAANMCCGVISQTWWREFPFPLGPCPNFATICSGSTGKKFCDQCFVQFELINN